ncbi:hypothetical protein [Thermotalea metallivorans]|uniref:hypothetical protein n=1 Tax=Thermotalea metallivorans TaxID=520762 RepID=UPI0012ED9A80|nr:hypothetical protein [Thermotalea metallivorans]
MGRRCGIRFGRGKARNRCCRSVGGSDEILTVGVHEKREQGLQKSGRENTRPFLRAPGMGSNLAVKVRYGLGSGNH